MPLYRTSTEEYNRHFIRHNTNQRVNRQTYCNLCYPSPDNHTIEPTFQRFWTYLSTRHSARHCTYYTVLTFNQLQEETNRGNTRFCLNIIYSISFADLLTDRLELAFYIAHFYGVTNSFQRFPTPEEERAAYLAYTAPSTNPVNQPNL